MQSFRNLKALPRLMASFGAILILMMAVTCLAVYSLSTANTRMDVLYNHDMVGLGYADSMVIDRYSLGREGRDAILNIDNDVDVADDQKTILANLADLHTSLDKADKTFDTQKGKEILLQLRNALPAYELAYFRLIDRVKAKDMPGSRAALFQVNDVGKPIFEAAAAARDLNLTLGQKKIADNEDAYQTSRTEMIAAGFFLLVFGMTLSVVIARGVSVPLGHAVAALDQMAAGDLTVSLQVETTEELGQMSTALNSALKRLRTTLQEVMGSANSASVSSQELSAAAESIATGSQEQAASLEETSASLEEITATVRQSADNAMQARQLASSSKETAEHGQVVVSNAVAAMEEINAASGKISNIISTIDEIAFQTNLLAVNAAVEAARAGEEGRGFAVVASEVRSLAQRSSAAAKEIKTLIQDTLRKVERGTDLVNKSGETLQSIVGSVNRVTDIINEISAASQEQSTGIEQVNTAVTQIDHVTQSNSAQTEELSSTAHDLSEQSMRLVKLVSRFRLNDSEHQEQQFLTAAHPAPIARPALSKPRLSSAKTQKLGKLRFGLESRNGALQALEPAPASMQAGDNANAGFEEF